MAVTLPELIRGAVRPAVDMVFSLVFRELKALAQHFNHTVPHPAAARRDRPSGKGRIRGACAKVPRAERDLQPCILRGPDFHSGYGRTQTGKRASQLR